jgi:thiol-disulfide isomerase/thioredoxin
MLRRPALLTVVLSAAAIGGYLTYRALIGDPAATPVTGQYHAAHELALADRLPEFSLGNLAGEPQSIGSWPGKPLLINFWATWCAPCLREIPMLKEFQDANTDLQVVGIAVDQRPAVETFAATAAFNYPVLIGQNEAWEAAAAFGVDFYALPFTVFTGADGSVLGVRTGELHPEHLEQFRTTVDGVARGRFDVATARQRLAASSQ